MLESDLTEDHYLVHHLERYFPSPLPERSAPQMGEHRLRREIIATVVANQLVDRAGTTFVFRLREETGAPPSLLARAYAIGRDVYGMLEFWAQVQGLDNEIDATVQLRMLIEGRRLVERAARWLVHAHPHGLDAAARIEHFRPGVQKLAPLLPEVLKGAECDNFETIEKGL